MPTETPLPAGTITFLFTDVVGNVPIWEHDPTAMKAALSRHHAILYAAAEGHHGLVFKILGDEFQIAFEVPENALEAALEAQRALRDEAWGATGPLTVRMGLHTGPAEIIEGVLNTRDYAVSHTLNRVARIRSAAHGGQILLSAATSELLHGYRPQEIHLRDMGFAYLKGMSLPEHLYQLAVPDLPDVFPQLVSISHPLHNLPLQFTSFIGREKEMAAITHLLQSNRLVTLTGPGGTGKTRLALQTAAGLLEQFADGVWLVELAPLADPALVPAIAARALGLRELAGPQVISLLQEYLEHRHLLLILDNCEHVIEACVRLADALLQACPKLSILTSSREALGIAGEVSFRVPPLAMPEATQSLPIEALGQYEAIRLFVERAATASPGFTLTPANAPAILQVCQRLDGIPLAIELAAARVKLLQVAEIAQRLDDRFRLLTGGSRAALPRHQTLRASIDWSYGLLSLAERTLLQRLSIFTGGWVLVAAEAVCSDSASGPSPAASAAEAVGCADGIQSCDVLGLLGQLVDKSLVQTGSGAGGLNRFRMLETIRQYAHEKLVESGQAEAARERHLQYYLELAEKMKIRGPDIAHILERLEAELDNLRLALAWSLEGKGRPGWDPEAGLRLASSLLSFWSSHGRLDEGIQWLELLLAGESADRGTAPLTLERVQIRARALQVASYLAWHIFDQTKAARLAVKSRELYQSLGAEGRVGYARACFVYDEPESNLTEEQKIQEALAILREAGDRFWAGELLVRLGFMATLRKEYERAKVYWEEFLASAKDIGDLDGIGGGLYCLSGIAFRQGKLEQSRALMEESLGIFIAIHNTSYQCYTYIVLGEFETMEGNYAQAAAYCSEALSIARRQGDGPLIHSALLSLGRLALIQGHTREAAERFEEDLAYFRKKDHKAHMAGALYYLGLLAWAAGDVEQAWRRYTDVLNTYGDFDSILKAGAVAGLGKVAFARGETHQAVLYFKQALGIPFTILVPENHYLDPTMTALEAMSFGAAALGQMECNARSSSVAARLLGATEAWHKMFYYARLPRERQEREACISALRAAMGEPAFTAAWAEGQAMSEEQAVEYADLVHYPENPGNLRPIS